MYFLYNLGLCGAALVLLPILTVRFLRGRFPGFAERFGARLPQSEKAQGQSVWIHAVSLGEVNCAAVLIRELKERFPDIRIYLSSSTGTGQAAARRIVGQKDHAIYPPLDLPFICRKFLRRIRPDALVVFETELWPNLFREAKRFGSALLVVNARISDRSLPRYMATRFLWRRVLAYPDTVFAQSASDAERFCAIGAPANRVRVTGNLKFAAQPQSAPFTRDLKKKLQAANVPDVIVAGSTMAGEEESLLDAFQKLSKERPRLLLILAPRHPERFSEVRSKIEQRQIAVRLRSEWKSEDDPLQPGILLLDTMGELASVYEAATVAFIGGTMVATGGHNILEPASFGRPIVIGPHMENFKQIADDFLQQAAPVQLPVSGNTKIGCIVQVTDADGLLEAFQVLLRDPAAANKLGEAAKARWKALQSGTDRMIDEICSFLPKGQADVRSMEITYEERAASTREGSTI